LLYLRLHRKVDTILLRFLHSNLRIAAKRAALNGQIDIDFVPKGVKAVVKAPLYKLRAMSDSMPGES
jgi:hypothetical protein